MLRGGVIDASRNVAHWLKHAIAERGYVDLLSGLFTFQEWFQGGIYTLPPGFYECISQCHVQVSLWAQSWNQARRVDFLVLACFLDFLPRREGRARQAEADTCHRRASHTTVHNHISSTGNSCGVLPETESPLSIIIIIIALWVSISSSIIFIVQ